MTVQSPSGNRWEPTHLVASGVPAPGVGSNQGPDSDDDGRTGDGLGRNIVVRLPSGEGA